MTRPSATAASSSDRRQEPGDRFRLEPLRLLGGEGRRDPGPLGVHVLALAEADDQRPPGLLGMDQARLACSRPLRRPRPRTSASAGRKLLVLVEAERPAGRPRPRRLRLSRFHLHRARVYAVAHAGRESLPLSSRYGTFVPIVGQAALTRAETRQNNVRKAARYAQHSHPRYRAHPLRQDGRDALLPRRDRPRRPRDHGGARALRGRPRAGRAGRLRPGPAGRPGPDPLAPGPDQGRDPEGGPLGDDQQGLRLGHALDRHRRHRDPRRRHRGRRHRRDGVDEPGAAPACPAPASGTGWATSKRSTRWSTTASPTPSPKSR